MFKVKHLMVALALVTGAAGSEDKDDGKLDRDNTGVNERDRDERPTAQSAGSDRSDVDVMAAIRRRVVDDGDLSTNAHNVKIIAEDGVVTLRGPVASAAERDTVERIAVDVVGKKNVKNELEIAP